jgi:hypothetical protein
MKKMDLIAIVAVFTTIFVFGCSKGYESQKTADDLTVKLSVGSYPLVKGDNTLTVKAADLTGKAVTDAQVNVRFYMPPMPGMAPMELNAQAMHKGNVYAFSVNPPMEGGWKAEVSIARPGKPAVTATFNLDVR